MSLASEFTKGFIRENPVFTFLLGMCPALAVTTGAIDGAGMGLCTTFVLVGSNLVVSLLRSTIPSRVRIPSFIVVIATFVTVVDLVLEGYFFELHKSLGIFIPLIVVNCIILARAEAFASKRGVLLSVADGLGMGLGFTMALVVLGVVREILGSGKVFGLAIFPESYEPLLLMVLPPGAFLSLGLLMALLNRLLARKPA